MNIHLVRASLMPHPIARFYLRHLARSTLAQASFEMERCRYSQDSATWRRATELSRKGLEYAKHSRKYAGGPIERSTEELPYWNQVTNPHWPDLTSHGVYVKVHECSYVKKVQFQVEVQVLPPDVRRSQVCSTRNFPTLTEAEDYARIWITIGSEILAATPLLPQETYYDTEDAT